MVHYLLLNGADLHQRCCGRFFFPIDQKNKLFDLYSKEYFTVPIETNYEGPTYNGEYPLSVAASLNQIDCVRLLIAKGANLNNQDSNGNTVMHLLIIHNNFVGFILNFFVYQDYRIILLKNF